jgi:hypothetical protein
MYLSLNVVFIPSIAYEFRSNVMCKMDVDIAGVMHRFENTSQVLLNKRKYQVPSKTQKKLSENFLGFPRFLQTSAEIEP